MCDKQNNVAKRRLQTIEKTLKKLENRRVYWQHGLNRLESLEEELEQEKWKLQEILGLNPNPY